MAIRTELTLRLQNSPGALGRVSRRLADERVNIVALALESSGLLRLLVDNHIHAASILREHHYQVEERQILYTMVPDEPGAFSKITQLIADAGVNLDYAYASAAGSVPMVGIVFGVADAERASAAAGI